MVLVSSKEALNSRGGIKKGYRIVTTAKGRKMYFTCKKTNSVGSETNKTKKAKVEDPSPVISSDSEKSIPSEDSEKSPPPVCPPVGLEEPHEAPELITL